MKHRKIILPYAGGTVKISVPESRLAGVLNPNPVQSRSPAELFKNAFSEPLKAPVPGQWIHGGEQLLVIVNDASRPTPTAAVLEMMKPFLQKTRVEFLVATGTHGQATELELRLMLGSFFETHDGHTHSHDCHDNAMLDPVGTTTRGTEVRINRRVMQADKILIIGSVEPHYFAGYTGGRKGLVPGVAGYRTIEQNHSHAMSEDVRPLRLAGNPVHEDMAEAVRLLGHRDIYSVQIVLDHEDRIFAVFAGDLEATLEAAAVKAREVYGVHAADKEDIVLAAAAPPLDRDLYQSQKAMEHARHALNPGGIMILVSACVQGIGPSAFYDLLTSHPDPEEILRTIKNGYLLGHHKAARWLDLAGQVSLYCVTHLDPDIVRKLGLLPFETVQHALDRALRERPGRILVMPYATVTVPLLEKQD
ncbi:nickel-dependent lactate racemase [bacterium]|nr:nickel-dependent lactate racemase [bacterium]